MQWNGVRPNPDRPAPLRSLMEILQQKAEPYVTEYGENQLPGAGQLLNSIMRTGTEMVPGVGDLLGAEDLQTAAQNSDWAGIGLGVLAAIPGIPAIGRGVRGEARAARGVANTVADAVPTNQPMTEAEAALARYRAAYPDATGARVLNPGDEGYPTNAQWDEMSQTYVEPVAPVEPDYPIRAYHGSPHSFDRFSLDKIGTGEGAQAYGHGLYFAESEDVARQYRDNVKNMAPIVEINQRLKDLSREMSSLETGYRQYREPRGYELAAEYDDLMSQRSAISQAPGSMYEVGINADPNTFLDWDRPLSEQPEVLQRLGFANMDEDAIHAEAARIFEAQPGGAWMEDPVSKARIDELNTMLERRPPSGTGQDFYRGGANNDVSGILSQMGYGDPAGQSQYLREAGIPGIRYLDGNSRGVGEGSRNYVLFNDELVKILRKYGISGLSTTVGASALAEELDRRGQTQEF